MVLTNWKEEIQGIRKVEGLSWQDLGDRMGVTRQGARGVINDTENIIPKSVVAALEAMGYDIEIEFIRRK